MPIGSAMLGELTSAVSPRVPAGIGNFVCTPRSRSPRSSSASDSTGPAQGSGIIPPAPPAASPPAPPPPAAPTPPAPPAPPADSPPAPDALDDADDAPAPVAVATPPPDELEAD